MLSPRDVTGNYTVKNHEVAKKWNCDTNGGDNLCHKSFSKIKSLTQIYKNG
jgi:hypothetical protein